MHSPYEKHKGANHRLSGDNGITSEKREQIIKYLSVPKVKLSPTENAMFLREIYDTVFNTIGYIDPVINDIYGSVLARPADNLADVGEYKNTLRRYHNLSIKKYTGYTLKEYLDLTPYEMGLVDQITEIIKEEQEYMEQLRKEQIEENKSKVKNTDRFAGYNDSYEELMKDIFDE